MTVVDATAVGIAAQLADYTFRYASEHELQSGIASALYRLGYQPHREVALSARDRVDVLVDAVAIEVKIAGTADALLRQLTRYAEHPMVHELLVVTTVSQHRGLAPMVSGKPCCVLHIGGVR